MSAHGHDVDTRNVLYDGSTFVEVPGGWAIAPGDANDVNVCGAHPWQSYYLVFADGFACGTAICDNPSNIGIINYLIVAFLLALNNLKNSHGKHREKGVAQRHQLAVATRDAVCCSERFLRRPLACQATDLASVISVSL